MLNLKQRVTVLLLDLKFKKEIKNKMSMAKLSRLFYRKERIKCLWQSYLVFSIGKKE